MSVKKYKVAVIGATGAVGRETLNLLAHRNFPYSQVVAIASDESLGTKVSFGDEKSLTTTTLELTNLSDFDIIFSSAGSAITKSFIQKVSNNCVVIDKTSLYRLDPLVPLIVPEVNLENLLQYSNKNIIANPNCCVIPLAMVLKPLDNVVPISRVVISTYQSISGAGRKAMHNLYEQTKNRFVRYDSDEYESQQNLAFNINPQIGIIQENGYSDEENKIRAELNKILGKHIQFSVTAVRVPVFIGHCFSVNIEFSDEFLLESLIDILAASGGIVVLDNAVTPIDVSGRDEVFVSRVRKDHSRANSINMWIASDNLRKGSSLNALQLAEKLVEFWQR